MTDLVERWRLSAAEWLDLQDAADMLTGTKSDVLAEIISEMDGSSHAERERQARLSTRWREFRDNMIKAESEARRAKLRLRHAQMKFDHWRTANANARQERDAGRFGT